jgi:hypothetical protein
MELCQHFLTFEQYSIFRERSVVRQKVEGRGQKDGTLLAILDF